jgi:DNA mismatch repair protein MutS
MYDDYEQYLKQYRPIYGPNTAIFLMVGSFYEIYDIVDPESGQARCNARDIADVLTIRLTKRADDVPAGFEGLFWGFPVDALHKWAGRLTDAGWTVVVVDQQATKAGRKLARAVSRILSPGTHIENNNAADTRSIVGIYFTGSGAYGAAAFDLSTGITITTCGEMHGSRARGSDELAHFLQVQCAAEVVLYWAGDALSMPTEEHLRRQLNYPRGAFHCKYLPSMGALSAPHVREAFFKEVYAIQSLLPVRKWLSLLNEGSAIADAEEAALTQLLLFIKQMNPSSFQKLHINRSYVAAAHMVLGNNALTQLQVVAPRIQESVVGLFQSCITPMGKRGIKRRLLVPIREEVRLAAAYKEIAEMQVCAASASAEAVNRRLREIYDLPRLHRRIMTAEPSADDICCLHQSYLAAESLPAFLPPSLQPPPGLIAALREWRSASFEAEFSIDKAAKASDDITFLQTSERQQSAAYTCEQELAAAATEVVGFVARCKSFAGVPADSSAIRAEVQEAAPYGIKATPVAAAALERVLKEKQEAARLVPALKDARMRMLKTAGWVECPWLTSLNDSVVRKRATLAAAVRAVLPDICGRVCAAAASGELWDDLEAWIERVDIARCLAVECAARGYVMPQLVPATSDGGGIFSATHLRHPLIESLMTRTEYVSHNVEFNEQARGWLVYGMNASGKSSLMKAIGIAIHLAQCGCFVPASSCKIAPFKALYTRIINRDDLWAGMSSFAMEMSEMREFLDSAGPGTMILGDELCSGTESQSAKAIVAAGIDWLSERKARYFFATHLHGLLDVLPPPEELALKVWHLRVEYDAVRDRLIYQRTLRPGPGSTLYGLEVARAMHLPLAFLEKAHTYRRKLLGTVREDEAAASAWNGAVVRRCCEVCGHEIVRDLEVHHIRPRVEAVAVAVASAGARFVDGAGRDDMRNLVVVCSRCHDAHHAGAITIGPLQQTSEGAERLISVGSAKQTATATADPPQTNIFAKFAYNHPASTSATAATDAASTGSDSPNGDDKATILHVLKTYPALPMRQLIPKLRNEYEIEVEESLLRRVKRTGKF